MDLIKILWIDDNEFLNEELLKTKFKKRFKKVEFQTEKTMINVLGELNSKHYDVILYDIGMDKDESFCYAQKIRDLKPGAILIAASYSMDCYKKLGSFPSNLPRLFDDKIDFLSIIEMLQGLNNKEFQMILKKFGINLSENR